MDDLRNRVRHVEEKLDLLAASLNTRFDGVDAAFVEQRHYTEFAFEQLQTRMDAGFARLDGADARLEAKMDAGFARRAGADARLEAKMDAGFARLAGADARLDAKMDAGDTRLEAKMDAGFTRLDASNARLEAKMDAGFALLKDFISEQRRVNELVERRLNSLTPGDDTSRIRTWKIRREPDGGNTTGRR